MNGPAVVRDEETLALARPANHSRLCPRSNSAWVCVTVPIRVKLK
jgi:hypothetical protein